MLILTEETFQWWTRLGLEYPELLIIALVSVFALQMAMIATFTEGGDIGEMGTFNIITGAAVFLLTLGMGIYMTVRAAYGLKKLKSAADGGAADGNECAAREEARDGNQNTDNAAQTGGEGV